MTRTKIFSCTANRVAEKPQLVWTLLADRQAGLLLFEEMEDAFRDTEPPVQGWFNQLLEQNTMATVWSSNRVDHVGPAFLRRFDLIIEISGARREAQQSRIKSQLSKLPVVPA